MMKFFTIGFTLAAVLFFANHFFANPVFANPGSALAQGQAEPASFNDHAAAVLLGQIRPRKGSSPLSSGLQGAYE